MGAGGQSRAESQHHVVFQGQRGVDIQSERPVQAAVRPNCQEPLEVFVPGDSEPPIDQCSGSQLEPTDFPIDRG